MRRAGLLLAAAAALALGAVAAPAPAQTGEGVLASIGRSMGGARVMLIDALFLRAEAQGKAGRIDDAAAIYETVLELDPDNQAASIFLVNVTVDELMPQVADLQDRFAWWLEARALLERALRRHPDAPALHARAASLVLDAVYADAGFLPLLEKALGRPDVVALGHLDRAAMAVATLPRQGRAHLVSYVLLAPVVAAAALRDGQVALLDRTLASIEAVLAKRGDVLAEVRIREDLPADCRAILRASRDAVLAARAARQAPAARPAFLDALETLRGLLGDGDLLGILDGMAR